MSTDSNQVPPCENNHAQDPAPPQPVFGPSAEYDRVGVLRDGSSAEAPPAPEGLRDIANVSVSDICSRLALAINKHLDRKEVSKTKC